MLGHQIEVSIMVHKCQIVFCAEGANQNINCLSDGYPFGSQEAVVVRGPGGYLKTCHLEPWQPAWGSGVRPSNDKLER